MLIDPKWGVILAALAVFAMAASVDARLGWSAAVVLVLATAIYLWIRVRLFSRDAKSRTDRRTMAHRYSLLGRNRREAQKARQLAEDARASRVTPS